HDALLDRQEPPRHLVRPDDGQAAEPDPVAGRGRRSGGLRAQRQAVRRGVLAAEGGHPPGGSADRPGGPQDRGVPRRGALADVPPRRSASGLRNGGQQRPDLGSGPVILLPPLAPGERGEVKRDTRRTTMRSLGGALSALLLAAPALAGGPGELLPPVQIQAGG